MASPLYWVSFQILTAFLLVNVVVAVVLQIFEDEMEKESARGTDSEVDIEDFELFGRVWTQFEPSYMMPVSKVIDFINELPPDLGLKGEEKRTSLMIAYLDELQLPCDGERVHYLDLLYRLSWKVYVRQHTEYDPDDYFPDDDDVSTTSSQRRDERVANFHIDMYNAITLLIRAQVNHFHLHFVHLAVIQTFSAIILPCSLKHICSISCVVAMLVFIFIYFNF